jgi:hypothetical protein
MFVSFLESFNVLLTCVARFELALKGKAPTLAEKVSTCIAGHSSQASSLPILYSVDKAMTDS